MNKIILSTIVAMLMGSSAIAGETFFPPVTKYMNDVPLPPKRPNNFGKIDNAKIVYWKSSVENNTRK